MSLEIIALDPMTENISVRLREWGQNRYHTDPDVLECAKYIDSGTAWAAFHESACGRLLHVFMRRPIEGFAGYEEYSDLISPYDFGGFILENPAQAHSVIDKFLKEFTPWCLENKIVCEFIRYNPFWEPGHSADVYDDRKNQDNVIVRLDKGYETINKEYSKLQRRNMKIAGKRGCRSRIFSGSPALADAFHTLYSSTMDRLDSPKFLRFSKKYFQTLFKLGPRRLKIGVSYNSESESPIAMAIFQLDNDIACYYLGCSDYESRDMRPNNALFDNAIKCFHDCGLKIFHLGGGARETLYRFKTQFGKDRIPYYTGRHIFNDSAYDSLVEMYLNNRNLQDLPPFPKYRSI